MSIPTLIPSTTDPPLIGILRGFDPSSMEGILQAAQRGGLRHVEITMNTPGAPEMIRKARAQVGHSLVIGAGTVTSERTLDLALDAGARFIVTPMLVRSVVRRCANEDIPVFPGACSPTEIVNAWEAGATMVKLFPADRLGPAYLRALRGPLPQIPIMPTGGVTLESVPTYRGLASGLAVGSPLFDFEHIRNEHWDWLEQRCRAFVQAASEFGSDRTGAAP